MPSHSRRTFLLATVATGLSGIAGCSRSQSCSPQRTQHETDISLSGDAQWPTQYYDSENTNYNPSARGPTEGVEVAWRYTICRPSEASTIVTPESTYLTNSVIDTQTGETAGEWPLSRAALTISNGIVYILVEDPEVDGTQLQAREASTGNVVWTTGVLNSVTQASPTVADGTVYTASGDLCAMDRETGENQWRFETAPEADAMGPPAVRGQTVYIADPKPTVYAVDTETGEERWTISTGQAYDITIPSVANDLVYFTSSGEGGRDEIREIRAVNPTDGSSVWLHEVDSVADVSIAVTDDTVFAVGGNSDGGLITALDAATGERRWQTMLENSEYLGTVAVGGENVYTGAIQEFETAPVYAFDQATGEQQWQFETRPRDFGVTVEYRSAPLPLSTSTFSSLPLAKCMRFRSSRNCRIALTFLMMADDELR